MSVHFLSSTIPQPIFIAAGWQAWLLVDSGNGPKGRTKRLCSYNSRADQISCLIHKWNLFRACCTLRLFFIGSPILCLLLLRHHHIPGSNPLIDCTRSTLIGIQWEQSLLPAGRAFTLVNPVAKGRGAMGKEVQFSLLFCLDLVFCEMRQSGTSGQERHTTMKTANQGIPRFILSWKAEASICTGHRSIFSSESEDAEPRQFICTCLRLTTHRLQTKLDVKRYLRINCWWDQKGYIKESGAIITLIEMRTQWKTMSQCGNHLSLETDKEQLSSAGCTTPHTFYKDSL